MVITIDNGILRGSVVKIYAGEYVRSGTHKEVFVEHERDEDTLRPDFHGIDRAIEMLVGSEWSDAMGYTRTFMPGMEEEF